MNDMSAGGDVLLSVVDLSVDFPLRTSTLRAVRNVNLELRRGKTLCLVGESGSGKSVTARAIMRIVDKPGKLVGGRILLDPGSGKVLDLAALSSADHRIRAIRGARIGFIFQEPMSALSPLYTIGSQIDEVMQLHLRLGKQAARARTVELLRQVEIADPVRMAERYSFEFSGGMRQRVCIAMALACNPEILIADEPTTALDVTTQAEILDLIKRLQAESGMAMLLITHDMGVVAEVASDVAVMRRGEIVEQGPVDDIFYNPRHPYTRRLLAATLKLEKPGDPTAGLPLATEIQPVLAVRNLTKVYGGRNGLFGTRAGPAQAAVDDASFDLYPGENLGIVGESGSGKTTLGRLILRVVEPTRGNVQYRERDGRVTDVLALDRQGLRRFHAEVRLIFQDPFASLNPRMSVKRIVGDPLRINGLARGAALEQRVAELLRLVGLDPSCMERYPHAFSGGQRQRIGIARALALDPRIVIADEATSALDVSIRSQILDLLLDLQKRLGLSFIFISHDISVVRYFCDRVAVMHRGRLVEIGDAESICTRPSQPYTQSLISAVPNPDPRNKRMLHRVRFDAAVGAIDRR
jgi:peptide/nickel transport system ATP-binding protein